MEHKNGKFIFGDKLVPLQNRTVVMAGWLVSSIYFPLRLLLVNFHIPRYCPFAELVKFHEYRANRTDKENQGSQTEAIPKEYLPLVGMLVQDR